MYSQEDCFNILKELAESKTGRRLHFMYSPMDDREMHVYHQIELLIDAGHVKKECDIVRVTMEGYDFIRAVESDDSIREKVLQMMKSGKKYIDAARYIAETVQVMNG